ncbi:hypothetical protein AIOL_004206 [Candidatus Rhodobacter oscarellae]|uniref:Uncharacterized protein n=1 Tax=Candidatus Rhodobacter oscarellae TaxID=1675527 RepID=A0A0J9E8W3_9RHOB|nr:hypothetical protein AIOL_004206 [Candidatus Rhodobacter lobularis]
MYGDCARAGQPNILQPPVNAPISMLRLDTAAGCLAGAAPDKRL